MENKWRQKLHLEPPHGWLNDPNGPCFYKGKYHFYFQYSPDGALGEPPRCWGHFESADLIHWDFTGAVLAPSIPEDRNGCYSGGTFIKDGVMHIFYTGNTKEPGTDLILHGRGANVIHVTTTDGHNMSGKKVLLRNEDYPEYCSCHVRDPRVWEQNGKYQMLLGARRRDDIGCILWYESTDLENWEFVRAFSLPGLGYMWECPDIFVLDGEEYLSFSPQGVRHETMRYQNTFQTGYFNNGSFEEWDYGFDFYAPQTFLTPDGRRIIIGWMGMGETAYTNSTIPLGWQHCLTVPREISRLDNGYLIQKPAREIEDLIYETAVFEDNSVTDISAPFELDARVTGAFKITLDGGLELKYDGELFTAEFTNEALGAKRDMRRVKCGECGDIKILADVSGLEIYLHGGRYVMSTRYYPEGDTVSVKAEGISGTIGKMKAMEVNFNGK
ncbi:MAG: glycoside hydrolase family 32 protein [Clostridia bacterium]|nr:glycoside hydrolase family 32 protein [Clostridia bacterium]